MDFMNICYAGYTEDEFKELKKKVKIWLQNSTFLEVTDKFDKVKGHSEVYKQFKHLSTDF